MPFSSASKSSVCRRFQNAVVCVRAEMGAAVVVNWRWCAYSWMAVYIISLSFLKFLLWMMISRLSGLYSPCTLLLFFPGKDHGEVHVGLPQGKERLLDLIVVHGGTAPHHSEIKEN